MKESDIMFEVGSYWVGRDRGWDSYVVYKVNLTHSVGDSAYPMTQDGLSIAIARATYLANRKPT